MNSCRTLLRNAIAVLGLVAVLLGALEHEDLILQELDGVEVGGASEAARTRGEAGTSGAIGAVAPATGTESTFRPEPHTSGLTEPDVDRVASLPHIPSGPRMAGFAASARRAPRCAPQAGTVALRL